MPSMSGAARIGRRETLAVLGLALAGSLAGCVGLPGHGAAPTLYRLSSARIPAGGQPPVAWQLVVEDPVAAGGLDTDRIALEPSPLRLEYFAGARWTGTAPHLVGSLLLDSFERSGRIPAVGREASGLAADFRLKSDLVDFEAVYGTAAAPPRVRVVLDVKLVEPAGGRILAVRRIAAEVPASADRMPAIVSAFDQALQKVLAETVTWTLREGASAAPGKPQS